MDFLPGEACAAVLLSVGMRGWGGIGRRREGEREEDVNNALQGMSWVKSWGLGEFKRHLCLSHKSGVVSTHSLANPNGRMRVGDDTTSSAGLSQ